MLGLIAVAVAGLALTASAQAQHPRDLQPRRMISKVAVGGGPR